VIRTTIRANQKCFVVAKPDGALANKFILVANIEAADGGAAIVAGNERVIRARLADAKFFYETDLKTRLEDRLPKFKHIVFHEKLGTQAERIERIEGLAVYLAPLVGADVEKAKRAARLCKADLLTDMVGEFPELQGLMGKYYARAQHEDESVAAACEEHYKPVGPSDRVPTDPVSVVVALADKIDTLAGFWAIDEKPTGSKDPYGLRRAASGIVRLIIENNLKLSTLAAQIPSIVIFQQQRQHKKIADQIASFADIVPDGISVDVVASFLKDWAKRATESKNDPQNFLRAIEVCGGVAWFIADRLKVALRDTGARFDLLDAIYSLHLPDDLTSVVRRVEALGKFLDTEDGKNLLAGYKRATNILRIEEKRDDTKYTEAPSAELFRQSEERELARAIEAAAKEAAAAVADENFSAAMSAMAKLRPHVDAFFEKVTVNADEPDVRANRLRLLNQIRVATRTVADFSKIEG